MPSEPSHPLDHLVMSNRGVDANFHLEQGNDWHQIGYPSLLHSPLIYAAFEYRCAIERIILELYDLMKELNIATEEFSSLKNISDIIKKIRQLEGGSHDAAARAIRFNAVYFKEMIAEMAEKAGISKEMAEPDLRKLSKLWGHLSEYCHGQMLPAETWNSPEWVKKGYALLDEALEYLRALKIEKHFGYMGESSLPTEALDLKKKFIDEEINESALITRLRIMKPIIEARGRKH
ncbi:hypothetical protein ACFL6E_02400 [Candidatus Neomarinimicrobiota bacterium]